MHNSINLENYFLEGSHIIIKTFKFLKIYINMHDNSNINITTFE
jgi:hypothetical protein